MHATRIHDRSPGIKVAFAASACSGHRTPEVQVRRALICFAAELAALPHTPWASYETTEAWRCSRTCMSLQAEAAASRTAFVGAPPYPAAPPVRAAQPQQARPPRPAPRSARHTHAASQAERQAPRPETRSRWPSRPACTPSRVSATLDLHLRLSTQGQTGIDKETPEACPCITVLQTSKSQQRSSWV